MVDSFAAVAFPAGIFSFSNRQIRRQCADSVNKFVRLIIYSLINSYLAFSFFSFFCDNVFAIRCMSMRTYASSRVKRKSFYKKSELQMFLLISGAKIGAPKRCSDMASPYKALQRCVKRLGK